MRRPELADLVAKLGPDHSAFPEVRDPYSNQPVPFEPAPIDPNAPPVDCGDTGLKLNPVVGHDGPALLIRLGPDGTMKLEAVSKGDTDVFRRSQRAMYAKRNKRWRETGQDEARSTDQLVGNPNEALDTETDIDDSD